ncbi:hypothetical protein B0J12DRAFT_747808 [Macrophomina phaseolina]|uniref:Uncharacterized protein n=1 Tax=Macrophomina phaseolina TaxID=35725 RepID=A0ABQ8FPV1_9PEZI|nr:hypothetical protein B0J12DRAFT_747808 [Macrophomina phaseolina]
MPMITTLVTDLGSLSIQFRSTNISLHQCMCLVTDMSTLRYHVAFMNETTSVRLSLPKIESAMPCMFRAVCMFPLMCELWYVILLMLMVTIVLMHGSGVIYTSLAYACRRRCRFSS